MFNLDFSKDTATNSYDPIEAGEYLVSCVKAEVKQTKDGQGAYVACEFRIQEGNHEGRKLFQNFTVANKSEKAVQIGRGQIKSFLLASGSKTFDMKDITDMCGKICIAKVGIEKSDGYADRNKITSFKSPTTTVTNMASSSSMTTTPKKPNPFGI